MAELKYSNAIGNIARLNEFDNSGWEWERLAPYSGKGDSGKGDSGKGDSGKGDSGKGDSGKGARRSHSLNKIVQMI